MVRRIKRLNVSRSARSKQRATVVEGARLVEEALAAGITPTVVAYSSKWVERPEGRALLTRLQARSIPLFYVTDRLFEELSQVDTPQGILAVIPLPEPVDLDTLLSLGPHPLLLPVALGIQDPGNLGTLMRAALAAGAQALGVAPGTVEAFNPKCLRASAGAAFRLPMVSLPDDWPARLKDHGVALRSTAVDEGQPYYDADWTGSVALVLGNEGQGLDSEWLAKTEVVTIPMSPASESLNVSMAGAILLFHVAFRRHEQGIGFSPPAMIYSQ